MTKPTPAQIEAAAEAINHALFDCGAKKLSLGEYDERAIAKAALTAAAEVGEPDPTIWVSTEAMNSERNATIERCARVADEYAKRYDLDECLEVAAAIRALKDK